MFSVQGAGLHLGVVEAEECEAGGVRPQRGVRAQDLLLVQPVRHAVVEAAGLTAVRQLVHGTATITKYF